MRTIFTLFFFLIGSSSLIAFGQDAQTVLNRKHKSLQHAESEIFNLPFTFDSIKTVVYPEIMVKREELAPHFPDFNSLPRTVEARDNAVQDWIENYASEYDAYYLYISEYIKTNRD